jgi:invasion protein IalB
VSHRVKVVGAALVLLTGTAAASGQQIGGLPGGASSLQERHGDWTVTCSMAEQDGTAKTCIQSQSQVDPQSNRRILSIEIRPTEPAAVGTIVLPFGLALAAGIQIAVDEVSYGEPLAFGTCLPIGCIVRSPLDAALIEAMKKGSVLTIQATAAGGPQTVFSASLKGFSAAYDRTVELAR